MEIKYNKSNWWDEILNNQFDQCFIDNCLSNDIKMQLFEDFIYQPFKIMAQTLVNPTSFAESMQMEKQDLVNVLIDHSYRNAHKYNKTIGMPRAAFIYLIMKRHMWRQYKIFKNSQKNHYESLDNTEVTKFWKNPPSSSFDYNKADNVNTNDFMEKLNRWWKKYGNSEQLKAPTHSYSTIYEEWVKLMDILNNKRPYYTGNNIICGLQGAVSNNALNDLNLTRGQFNVITKYISAVSKELYDTYYLNGKELPSPEQLGKFSRKNDGKIVCH